MINFLLLKGFNLSTNKKIIVKSFLLQSLIIEFSFLLIELYIDITK